MDNIGLRELNEKPYVQIRCHYWGLPCRCTNLRKPLTVIGDELDLPYHRPPLSKDFLSGQKAIEDILIRPAEVYTSANIEMRLGERVAALDANSKTIRMEAGDTLSYDKLVLKTCPDDWCTHSASACFRRRPRGRLLSAQHA